MKDVWLYTVQPDCDGDGNMRSDEAMAQLCSADGRPRLRLYSWRPHTLSLGYNQPADSVDMDALSRLGYGLVRRPTGGRAVLHADEITYAVVMPAGAVGIHETYRRINMALARGLELLGARDIEFSRAQPDFRSHYELGKDSANCFSAAALSELTWRGRKLCGSAQRRYGDTLLQHGSLLLDEGHLDIVSVLYPGADPGRHHRLRTALAERTATLRQILDGTLPSFVTIAEALTRGFGAEFGAEMRETDMNPSIQTPWLKNANT